MASSRESVVHSWFESLKKYDDGDVSSRLSQAGDDPDMESLRLAINRCLDEGESRSNELHTTAMELAMGLSECFTVLSQLRSGNFDMRVSDDTLNSSVELVSKLAGMLNETIDDMRELNLRQEMTIRELSMPILQIWEGIILAPLIGVIDSRQALDVMDRVLKSIAAWKSRYVILDLTGVDIVDTKTADHLIKIARSAHILGAQCVLTGIQPAVAQTLIEIGVDLSGLKTVRNLEAGLRACLKEMQASQ